MRVKLDENMPELVATFLKSQGCDVETVLSEKLGGSPDPAIVAAAKREQRVLITLDKGIANIRNPQYAEHAGLVLLRLKHPGLNAILSLMQKHYPELANKTIAGRIVV